MEAIFSFLVFYTLPIVIVGTHLFLRFCRVTKIHVAEAFKFSEEKFKNEGAGGCYDLLKRVAKKAGINPPALHVIQGDVAASFGLKKNLSAVTIGVMNLRLFNATEMEATFAHEVAHIVRGDALKHMVCNSILLSLYLCALATFLVLLLPALVADVFGGASPFSDLLFVLHITLTLTLLWVGFELVYRFHLRYVECKADEKAAELVGDPQKMIQVLRRLEGIRFPQKKNVVRRWWFAVLFWATLPIRTHPTYDRRIARLEKLAKVKA